MFNQRTEGYADHLCAKLGPTGIALIWTRSEELTRCCEAVTRGWSGSSTNSWALPLAPQINVDYMKYQRRAASPDSEP